MNGTKKHQTTITTWKRSWESIYIVIFIVQQLIVIFQLYVYTQYVYNDVYPIHVFFVLLWESIHIDCWLILNEFFCDCDFTVTSEMKCFWDGVMKDFHLKMICLKMKFMCDPNAFEEIFYRKSHIFI